MTTRDTGHSRTSRVVAGVTLAGIVAVVALSVVEPSDVGGLGIVVAAAAVGFVLGYALGMPVTDFLLHMFS